MQGNIVWIPPYTICKTWVNLNFSEKGQNGKLSLQYKLQNWNFSRSRMTKWTSPLDLSHEIYLPRLISLNSETIRFVRFSGRWAFDKPQKWDFGKILKVEK